MQGTRREFTRRSDRIEELVNRIEALADPAARAVTQELLQAVVELHAVALDRILNEVASAPQGKTVLQSLSRDDLVSSVLSLHGINPVPVEARVSDALEKARPYLQSHGGDVQLASVHEATVRVRLQGSCGSCSSSAETLRSTVEAAVYNAAPEVATVVAEMTPSARKENLVVIQTR